MIYFEQDVCKYLNIPSVPKRVWDGKSSFKRGVVVTTTETGAQAYAVCTFDNGIDEKPRVVKVFSTEIFSECNMDDVRVVPEYMDVDGVDGWDLDEQSKKAAESLIEEVEEMQGTNVETENPMDSLPEWVFPEIHNREEAVAWLKRYSRGNRKKGKIPTTDENIKLRLYAIYSEIKKK